MQLIHTEAEAMTMTEPNASANTWRNTPRIFICEAFALCECDCWHLPSFFLSELSKEDGAGGTGGWKVSSFSLSSVATKCVSRVRLRENPPWEWLCVWPCSASKNETAVQNVMDWTDRFISLHKNIRFSNSPQSQPCFSISSYMDLYHTIRKIN